MLIIIISTDETLTFQLMPFFNFQVLIFSLLVFMFQAWLGIFLFFFNGFRSFLPSSSNFQ